MRSRSRGITVLVIVVLLISASSIVVTRVRGSSVARLPQIDFGELSGQYGRLTFVRRAEFPAAPAEVRIHRIVSIPSKKDALLRIFRALPISSDRESNERLSRLERAPGWWGKQERSSGASIGGWRVEVWNDGHFIIDNSKTWTRPRNSAKAPAAPTPEEARKAADAFLAKVMPSAADLRFVRVREGEVDVYGAGTKPSDRVVRSLIVSYTAGIGGIPVYGPVSVYVGHGPEVASAMSWVREVAPDQQVPILSPQEAFEMLRAGKGHIQNGPVWEATANVTSIALVYFPAGKSQNESHMVPYAFQGQAIADGMRSTPWWAIVEAIRR